MTIYSHSRLEAFKSCPLKYKFNYIDKIKREEEGIEAFLGSRFHEVMEKIYKGLPFRKYSSLPEQSKMDEDRQLALYQIGIQNMWKDVYNVELVWHYVAFDKEIRSKRTEEELDELKKDTIDLIKKIEATREFLPNESTLCGWCYYKDICPLYKHEYMVGNLPANKYLKDNGIKLVNEFAKLDDKKKGYKVKIEEIDEELEKIKEAVIQYAGNIGVEVVIGSDHKLKISPSEKINVPGKGTKERESLIELLSQLNRLEEVSAFDVAELKKVIKEEKWDSAILDEIKKLVEIETVKSVRLSKSKRED